MKTSQGFGKALFSGKSVTKKDIELITQYNSLKKQGVSVIKSWNDSMSNATIVAQQGLKATLAGCKSTKDWNKAVDDYIVKLKSTTTASKAATVATKAFAIAGNMLLMWGVSKAIELTAKAIDDYVHAAEYARKRSDELTNSWKTENSSIDDSISKYKELKEKLKDTSLSTSEVKSAKEQLASVQNSLIDKYGLEALGIDLVNGKYDEQIAKLDELSRK